MLNCLVVMAFTTGYIVLQSITIQPVSVAITRKV